MLLIEKRKHMEISAQFYLTEVEEIHLTKIS